MIDFELAIKNEKERHEAAMVGILDMLESTVVTKLKKCGNFMILPHDEDVSVKIVDGVGRNVVYNVYAIGLTTDDRVIYVTSEALYDEWDRKYDSNDEYKTEDGSWTETSASASECAGSAPSPAASTVPVPLQYTHRTDRSSEKAARPVHGKRALRVFRCHNR